MQDYDFEALREICSQIDLLDYAGQSMDFRRKGADSYAAHCPRHIDKTASLFITPSKNQFHCFSCGVSGSILQWLMIFEGMSFNDAIDKIGYLSGYDMSKLKQCTALKFYKSLQRLSSKPENKTSERTYLPESDLEQFSKELPKEWIDEGIAPDVMQRFNIRIDEKSNRIIYPIYDSEYKLIGFKGRTRFDNYKDMGLQKYINYTKIGTTDFFVGMKENHSAIEKNKSVIIFEGIKSVMKACGWGYENTVAAETSCLNKEQIKLLIKMGIREVNLAFDSDVATDKTIKSINGLKRFTNVFIIQDRKNKDRKLLGEKEAPVDRGREVFETLLNERIRI